SEVLVDSLYDYATAVWAYSATGVANDRVRLSAVHGKFATTLGVPRLGPLAVNPLGMVLPAGRDRVVAAMQYSLRKPARIIAEACLTPKSSGTGTAEFKVAFNGQPGQFGQVPQGGLHIAREIAASAGDTINFQARAKGGPAVIAYRYRIVLAGTQAARETLRCN
ncbi:MAG: hypothetical protein ACKOVA_15955, partial [Novosphingobium sp.]